MRNMEKQLAALNRQKQALQLAQSGVDYQTIADKLGFNSRQAAWKSVKSALNRTLVESAEELRTMQISRLDKMLSAIWVDVIKGNLKAIDRAIKLEERRAKLLGLDAPTKNLNLDLSALTDQQLEQLAAGEDLAHVLKRTED
jgi:hypothetical protein